MKKRITLKNPDEKEVYEVWHYCPICFAVFSHSQGDFNTLKYSECCVKNLKTLPIEIKEITIEIEKEEK